MNFILCCGCCGSLLVDWDWKAVCGEHQFLSDSCFSLGLTWLPSVLFGYCANIRTYSTLLFGVILSYEGKVDWIV